MRRRINPMPVQVQCPHPDCQAGFGVAEEDLGGHGRCPRCGRTVPFLATTQGLNQPPSLAPNWESSAAGAPSEWTEGMAFGRYTILKLLGRGGMGAVYLAEDPKLRRWVALKVPSFGPQDAPQAVKRFEREARALAEF